MMAATPAFADFRSLACSGTWLGVPIQKNAWDLIMLQEIIYETKPDIIIETGTFWGGSALFMAGILESIGKGIVISIDLVKKKEQARAHDYD